MHLNDIAYDIWKKISIFQMQRKKFWGFYDSKFVTNMFWDIFEISSGQSKNSYIFNAAEGEEVLEITSGAYLIYSCYSSKYSNIPPSRRQKYNSIFLSVVFWQNAKNKKNILPQFDNFFARKDSQELICSYVEPLYGISYKINARHTNFKIWKDCMKSDYLITLCFLIGWMWIECRIVFIYLIYIRKINQI